MALKIIIASILAAGTAVAASAAHPVAAHSSSEAPPKPCATSPAQPIEGVATAIRDGILVSRGGGLALAGGPSVTDGVQAADAVVRHVTSDARFGLVYVRDLPGGDDVVIDTPAGRTELHRPSEVSHPTWTPDGDVVWGEGARLRFWSDATGTVSSSTSPIRGGLVFSPVAPSRASVVAAVVTPVTGSTGEDEQLSNLWRYDRRGGGWRQLTRFRATEDRWSIIRTPEVSPEGIGFIRARGRASATGDPTFERWSLSGRRARLEEVLPGERYLAGYRDGARLWNLPSDRAGTWVLAEETSTGSLHELGCGAVAVDPVDVPDPDRAVTAHAPDPTYPVPPPSPQPPAHEVAVLVGDYAGESGATNAAQAIIAAYGPDAQVKVVDSDAAPTAVKPGSWAAIMWIGADGDPVNAIQHFWNKLPQFADRSWVAAP